MGITRSKPEKERLVLGTLPDMAYPVFRSSRSTPSGDLIKSTVLVSKHMIFTRQYRVISSLTQEFRETNLLIRQTNMQLRGARIVRIATGYDTAPGGTATTGGQICVIKTHTTLRQKIDMGSLDDWMTIAPKIILRNIIGYEKYDVGLLGKRSACTKQGYAKQPPNMYFQA